jgi:hypothetical protein
MKYKLNNFSVLLVLILLLIGQAHARLAVDKGDGNFSTDRAQAEQAVSNGAKAVKIDELMRAYERAGILSGTILVAEKGNVIFKRGFGYAHAEFKIPNAADTSIEDAAGTVETPPGARMRVKNPNPVIERLATGYVKTPAGYVRAPLWICRARTSARRCTRRSKIYFVSTVRFPTINFFQKNRAS